MFDIEIAGVRIRVHNHRGFVFWQCWDYIVKPPGGFTEEQLVSQELVLPEPPDIEVDTTKEEILAERDQAEPGIRVTPGYCEALCVYRKIALGMIDHNAFLMHASVIAVDGEAYAFAARSGTGKSTQTLIWQKEFGDRAVIVNGDKPILRFFPDGKLYACGTPWAGKENLGCNMKAPLRAVLFVERSPENRIRKMSSEEVTRRLFDQLLFPKEEESMTRFLELVDRMLGSVDFYLLECNMNQDAALTAWKGIHQC